VYNFWKVTAIPLRQDPEVILRNSITRLSIYKKSHQKRNTFFVDPWIVVAHLFYCILNGLECSTVYCNNKARSAKRFLRLSKYKQKNMEYSGRKDRENKPIVM